MRAGNHKGTETCLGSKEHVETDFCPPTRGRKLGLPVTCKEPRDLGKASRPQLEMGRSAPAQMCTNRATHIELRGYERVSSFKTGTIHASCWAGLI